VKRRTALCAIAPAATGCLPRTALTPSPLPRDRAAVLQTLLPGQPVPPIGVPESPWHVVAEAPAEVRLDGTSLVVRSEPGRRAFVSPRAPFAPLGYAPPRFVEELSWLASISITPGLRFFVLCELRFAGEPGAILLQPTPFDLQVSLDPERPAGGTSVSVSRLLADGRERAYRLRATEQRVELYLNGSPIWTLEGGRVLSSVAFGETRTDALHGGELRLRDVVYIRRPALPDERAFLE
jgi:hypothetical protein